MELTCPWIPVQYDLQPWIGAAVIVIGILGALGNIGLITSLVFGDMHTSLPHVSLIFLVSCAVAGLGRALLAGFPFTAPGMFTGGWIFGPQCCQLFAALGHYFFTAQVMILAALAFERYREAKANSIGGAGMKRYSKFYLVTSCCWGLGILWAVLPLFHFGRYMCDVTNAACDLDWRLSSSTNSAYITLYAIFGVLLPILATIVWLTQALIIICPQAQQANPWDLSYVQTQQTKVVLAIFISLLITWTPKLILAIWTIFGFPQDLHIRIGIQPILICIITISNELSVLVVPVILHVFDYFVRGSIVRLWRYQHYDNEISGDNLIK